MKIFIFLFLVYYIQKTDTGNGGLCIGAKIKAQDHPPYS